MGKMAFSRRGNSATWEHPWRPNCSGRAFHTNQWSGHYAEAEQIQILLGLTIEIDGPVASQLLKPLKNRSACLFFQGANGSMRSRQGLAVVTKVSGEFVAILESNLDNMNHPRGWRRDNATGEVEWTEIPICKNFQGKYDRSQFPDDVTWDPGRDWDLENVRPD